MDTIAMIIQIIIAAGIFNVWIIRFGKPTNWRGGQAKNMKEEFSLYGLPSWFVGVIGFLKLLLAILLVVGIWIPSLTNPAAYGMALLMLGAVAMHLKVKDPLKKFLPALTVLFLLLIVIVI